MEPDLAATHETTFTITHEQGLHARPADLFVRRANAFTAEIFIYNLTRKPDKKVNAKSILGLLSIGVHQGDQVRLVASGADSQAAIQTLTDLVSRNFTE